MIIGDSAKKECQEEIEARHPPYLQTGSTWHSLLCVFFFFSHEELSNNKNSYQYLRSQSKHITTPKKVFFCIFRCIWVLSNVIEDQIHGAP